MDNLKRANALISSYRKFELIKDSLSKSNVVSTDKITGSLKTLLAIDLFRQEKSVFLPHNDIISAKKTKSELELMGFEKNSLLFSSVQIDLNTPSVEEILNKLLKENFIIICTYKDLFSPVIDKSRFEKNLLNLDAEAEISYDDFIELLESNNYVKSEFVEEVGFFATRGSIIDVFSYCHANPVRIEFEFDKVHSLRLFDIGNQRSFQMVDEYTIFLNQGDEGEKNLPVFEYVNQPYLILDEVETEEYDINNIKEKCKIVFQNFLTSESNNDSIYIPTNSKPLPYINSNLKLLNSEIERFNKLGYKIFIFAEQVSHANRIKELLLELSSVVADVYDDGALKIEVFPLQEGYILNDEKIVYFTEHQIFNRPFSTITKYKKVVKGSSGRLLNTIKNGDFVVHSDYGVGRFAGLVKIHLNDSPQEVMKIEYQNNDKVFVNINYLGKIKKYVGKDNNEPHLSKLGSTEWKKTKQKIKKKIAEVVKELIKLYAERKASKGFSFSKDTVWQKELESSFYYEDTPDQLKVTNEIKMDMESENPMDRLVCGDVGFGKTEVAVRAAFKSVMDNKQVAVLVPTTILAEQHFNTFSDRLGNFPVTVKVLSRFIKKPDQKETLKELSDGKVDVLIGTHRLLSKDVSFKDIGLLIIDEEHRFGVMAKEKIRQFKSSIDTLYLTATPIPRTLNMSLAGSKDISIIATPPPNRLPIITEISRFDIIKIREVIIYEMSRDGQVFFVHDRVKSIDKMAKYLKENIPEAKFGIVHGQLKPDEIEIVLHNFLQKKYDVLVCTKIIESGLDIPNANTIIINRADRFGLAELHQLRGRVGRANKQAFAYLFVPSLDALTRQAIQRIQAFEEHSELGSGFNLAMRDLEIRGSGNLLGTEQSGFVNSVGFDMYIKLLEETVEEVKENDFRELFRAKPAAKEMTTDTVIEAFFDYNIPQYYIDYQDERLYYYTKLFTIKELSEVDDIRSEIKDKYGDLPEPVENLIELAKIKYLAARACFEKIEIGKNRLVLNFPKKELSNYYNSYFNTIIEHIVGSYSSIFKIYETNGILKLKVMKEFHAFNDLSDFIKSFFKEIILEIGKRNQKLAENGTS